LSARKSSCRGGARYCPATGKLLTKRRRSSDPAITRGFSMPSSLNQQVERFIKDHNLKFSEFMVMIIKKKFEKD